MSTEQPIENVDSGDQPAVSPSPPAETPRPARVPGLASGPFTGAAFAVVGSLFAWALIELFHPVFKVPSELMVERPSQQQEALLAAAEFTTGLYNAALALGVAGAILAGALAMGEGWARRSWKMAIAGFLGCALAGAFFGGLAGWVGHSVFQFAKLPGALAIDLEGTVVVQMTMLAVLGAGIGLVLGSLTGEAGGLFTRVLAGALAGVLAGLVCPFATANLLPAANTENIVPQGKFAALLWLGLTGVLLGLIIPGMKLRRAASRSGPSPGPAPAKVVATDEL